MDMKYLLNGSFATENDIDNNDIYPSNNDEECYEEELCSDYNCNEDYYDYEYTLEDTWDAMTDGMYGDMPEGWDGDLEFLGY